MRVFRPLWSALLVLTHIWFFSPPGNTDYPAQPGGQVAVAGSGQWSVRGRGVCHFLAERQKGRCEISSCPLPCHRNPGGWALEMLQLQWRSFCPPLADPQKMCSLNTMKTHVVFYWDLQSCLLSSHRLIMTHPLPNRSQWVGSDCRIEVLMLIWSQVGNFREEAYLSSLYLTPFKGMFVLFPRISNDELLGRRSACPGHLHGGGDRTEW